MYVDWNSVEFLSGQSWCPLSDFTAFLNHCASVSFFVKDVRDTTLESLNRLRCLSAPFSPTIRFPASELYVNLSNPSFSVLLSTLASSLILPDRVISTCGVPANFGEQTELLNKARERFFTVLQKIRDNLAAGAARSVYTHLGVYSRDTFEITFNMLWKV